MPARERTTKMNKKLSVLNAVDNIIEKYPETKEFIDSNMKEVCEGESMTVEELIYFIG